MSLTSCQLALRSLPVELDIATDSAHFIRIVAEGWLALFDGLLIHIYKVTIDIYAHIVSSIQSLTNSRISSKVMGSCRWNPSLSVVVISQQSFALRSRLSVTIPVQTV